MYSEPSSTPCQSPGCAPPVGCPAAQLSASSHLFVLVLRRPSRRQLRTANKPKEFIDPKKAAVKSLSNCPAASLGSRVCCLSSIAMPLTSSKARPNAKRAALIPGSCAFATCCACLGAIGAPPFCSRLITTLSLRGRSRFDHTMILQWRRSPYRVPADRNCPIAGITPKWLPRGGRGVNFTHS